MGRPLLLVTARVLDRIPQISEGKYPRIEDLLVGELLRADLLDYTYYDSGIKRRLARTVEQKMRLDWGIAYAGMSRSDSGVVISTSQKVGIPFWFLKRLLRRRIPHVMFLKGLTAAQVKLFARTRILQEAAALIVLIKHERDLLVNHFGIDASRVYWIPKSVDHCFFYPRGSRTEDSILSVGWTGRDFSVLFSALWGVSIPLVLAAGTRYYSTQGLFGSTNVPSNLTVVSNLALTELREYYDRCRFVVVSLKQATMRLGNRDSVCLALGGSTVITEAMAMGKAVVATGVPGMEDYVVHGETGLLVEQENPEDLRQAIRLLWDNPELAAEMGRKGRQKIEEEMNIDAHSRKWAEIISMSQ